MNTWNQRASVELVEALVETGCIGDEEYLRASELIRRGESYDGVAYALRRCGLR